MRTIQSEERSTGMGATRYTAILTTDGTWRRVSSYPEARYHGRVAGVEKFSMFVAVTVPWAEFYRSNRGNEQVTIHDPYSNPDNPLTMEVASFQDADRWARGENISPDTN